MISQLGILESTNHNDGDEIDKYLKTLALPKGSSYCVAGLYYCFAESCRRLGIPPSWIPLCRTGLAIQLFKCSKSKGRLEKAHPIVDDIIVWVRKHPFGHAERIISVERYGWVETIGFNTRRYNPKTKRFEEGVFRWRRNLYHRILNLHLIGFIGFYSR